MPENSLSKAFLELIEIIKILRDPEKGCPWDIEQTHLSLIRYLLEESTELSQALIGEDRENIIDELGDVLLQVLLHAQIGMDQSNFSIEDVIKNLSEKLITRHPHVFSDVRVKSKEEVIQNWKKIKGETKGENKEIVDFETLKKQTCQKIEQLSLEQDFKSKTDLLNLIFKDLTNIVKQIKLN